LLIIVVLLAVNARPLVHAEDTIVADRPLSGRQEAHLMGRPVHAGLLPAEEPPTAGTWASVLRWRIRREIEKKEEQQQRFEEQNW
jgi:hypothetical protein